MSLLEKTVTVRVKVDPRIADLVYFVQKLQKLYGAQIANMREDELIVQAESFWDSRHGEE